MDTPISGKSQSSNVKIRLTISCGCGLVAEDVVEALRHAEESGHLLTVHGQVGTVERLNRVTLVERRVVNAPRQ